MRSNFDKCGLREFCFRLTAIIASAIAFAILSAPSQVLAYTAADSNSKIIYSGQNVTQTAWVYPSGRCTLGTQLAGCGLTEKFTLATSPWLLAQYNMANANLRYQLSTNETLSRALQVSYFKTYPTGEKLPEQTNPSNPNYDPDYCRYYGNSDCFTGYDMEALWVYYAQSEHITSTYNFHWNVSAAYYWNDLKPFSLRRPQQGSSPWQLNLMTLHEFHMSGPWFLQAELGILGLQRKYPPFHSGASLSYRTKRFMTQFGFSATGSIEAWFARDRKDYHSEALYYVNGIHQEYTENDLRTDFSIHPEILLQYFFDL